MSRVAIVNTDYPDLVARLGDLGYQVAAFTHPRTIRQEIAIFHPEMIVLTATSAAEWDVLDTIKLAPAMTRVPVLLCTNDAAKVRFLRFDLYRRRVFPLVMPCETADMEAAIEAFFHPQAQNSLENQA